MARNTMEIARDLSWQVVGKNPKVVGRLSRVRYYPKDGRIEVSIFEEATLVDPGIRPEEFLALPELERIEMVKALVTELSGRTKTKCILVSADPGKVMEWEAKAENR